MPPPINPVPPPANIRLGLFPGDDYPVVVEMASTLGASTAFVPTLRITASALAAGGFSEAFNFPVDGRRRYFRARHEANGYNPGSYTRTVSALPRLPATDGSTGGGFGGRDPRLPRLGLGPTGLAEDMMTGEGTFSASSGTITSLVSSSASIVDMVSTGDVVVEDVYVGGGILRETPAGPGTVTKTLRVGGAMLRPAGAGVSSTEYNHNVGGFSVRHGTSSTDSLSLTYTFVVPVGVTITNFDAELLQLTSGAGASLDLGYTTGAAAGVSRIHLHETATSDGTWQILQTSSISHTVTEDQMFVLAGTINSSAVASGAGSGCGSVKLTYTMPDYESAY